MPEKKILIVDDNADLVRIMGVQLEGHGYSVVSASDVPKAMPLCYWEQERVERK